MSISELGGSFNRLCIILQEECADKLAQILPSTGLSLRGSVQLANAGDHSTLRLSHMERRHDFSLI